jgi:flagellar basal-body rod modification protein FlgD
MITAVRNTPLFSALTSESAVEETPKGPLEPSAARELPKNSSAMGKDEFLQLLVAQLKNQDPLNPMDGKDMAAQLAQFSTVEQLIDLNESMEASKAAEEATAEAIKSLEETQKSSAEEVAALIEGQMAMSTVGKVGVTTGNRIFIERDGAGQLVVDNGTSKGVAQVTVLDDKGNTVTRGYIEKVEPGMQAYDVRDITFDPPLTPGSYQFKFEVATDGGQWRAMKTYSAGRITGMKYDQGNPVLLIGNSLSVPLSQLIQIRS